MDTVNVELLYSTTDARVWAQEFCKNYNLYSKTDEVIKDTEGVMIGWFANAIETAKGLNK